MEAGTPILRADLLARFKANPLQFVFRHGVLTGVVHFSDYNLEVVGLYLYAQIARYERGLRKLLKHHNLKNEDMLERFRAIADTTKRDETRKRYEKKICDFKKDKDKFAKQYPFQSFYLDDLVDLAKNRGVIELSTKVKDLRNQIMHSHALIDMADASTDDFIYDVKSFEKFFKRAGDLLTDSLRVHNQLLIKSECRKATSDEGAGTLKGMTTMKTADRIRAYVIECLIAPARTDGQTTLTVRAGTVHKALGLRDRMPAVCSALDAAKFYEAAGVTLIRRAGPPQGATAEWVLGL